jgi:hypothetical protein
MTFLRIAIPLYPILPFFFSGSLGFVLPIFGSTQSIGVRMFHARMSSAEAVI